MNYYILILFKLFDRYDISKRDIAVESVLCFINSIQNCVLNL